MGFLCIILFNLCGGGCDPVSAMKDLLARAGCSAGKRILAVIWGLAQLKESALAKVSPSSGTCIQ